MKMTGLLICLLLAGCAVAQADPTNTPVLTYQAVMAPTNAPYGSVAQYQGGLGTRCAWVQPTNLIAPLTNFLWGGITGTITNQSDLWTWLSLHTTELTALEGRSNTWNTASTVSIDATNRIAGLEGRSNTWNTASTVSVDATNRIAGIEGRSNVWNTASTVSMDATNRIAGLEGRSNTWNTASTVSMDATNRLAELESLSNGWQQVADQGWGSVGTGAVLYAEVDTWQDVIDRGAAATNVGPVTMIGTLTLGDNLVDGRKFGNRAGENASGIYYVAIGDLAAGIATGNCWTALGGAAGYNAAGHCWIAAGNSAGAYAVGDRWGAFGSYAGYGAIHTNSHSFGYYAGRNARGNNRMYLDAYESDPSYAAGGPTNDTIWLDSDGHLYLGGGNARAENPNAGGTLRGTWNYGGSTLPSMADLIATNAAPSVDLTELRVAYLPSVGSELVINGILTNSAAQWTLGGGAVAQPTGTYSNTVKIAAGTTGTLAPTAALGITSGKTYRVVYSFIALGGETLARETVLGLYTNAGTIAATGYYTNTVPTHTADNLLISVAAGAVYDAYIDNISVKEVTDGDAWVADDLHVGGALLVGGYNLSAGLSVTQTWISGPSDSVTNIQVYLLGRLQTWSTNGVALP